MRSRDSVTNNHSPSKRQWSLHTIEAQLFLQEKCSLTTLVGSTHWKIIYSSKKCRWEAYWSRRNMTRNTTKFQRNRIWSQRALTEHIIKTDDKSSLRFRFLSHDMALMRIYSKKVINGYPIHNEHSTTNLFSTMMPSMGDVSLGRLREQRKLMWVYHMITFVYSNWTRNEENGNQCRDDVLMNLGQRRTESAWHGGYSERRHETPAVRKDHAKYITEKNRPRERSRIL